MEPIDLISAFAGMFVGGIIGLWLADKWLYSRTRWKIKWWFYLRTPDGKEYLKSITDKEG